MYKLGYPTCNVHAPYCHLWPVQLYHIFSTLSHKLKKKIIKDIMYVLIFSTNVSQTILILRKTEQDMIKKHTLVFT